MTFQDLGLVAPILDALKEKNYVEPTPIQGKVIPIILENRDVLGCAQTGTGKTAAFSIPVIQQLLKADHKGRKKIRSLIVTPTRELAIQIEENIKAYSKFTNLKQCVIFGGVSQGKQVNQLKAGVDILIATPGRLLDLIDQRYISLRDVEFLVLDEADRMLDMGFINDINKILKLVPDERQTLFFSATMPENILKLASTILTDPVRVEVSPVSSTADTVEQQVYYTNRDTKNALLLHLLNNPEMDQVLLFSKTKHGADRIVRNLKKKKIQADAIHGNKSQNQRQKALSFFKDGKIRVLVATDIAARGIDINELQYVINYDIPNEPETYVHRIGRSGRAGKNGIAISICEPEENIFLRDIEKLIGKQIPKVDNQPFPQTDKPMTAKEKKEWNKEKQKRKQEFFKNRKASGNKGRRR